MACIIRTDYHKMNKFLYKCMHDFSCLILGNRVPLLPAVHRGELVLSMSTLQKLSRQDLSSIPSALISRGSAGRVSADQNGSLLRVKVK